jgi:hypothetical protein
MVVKLHTSVLAIQRLLQFQGLEMDVTDRATSASTDTLCPSLTQEQYEGIACSISCNGHARFSLLVSIVMYNGGCSKADTVSISGLCGHLRKPHRDKENHLSNVPSNFDLFRTSERMTRLIFIPTT